MMMTVKASEIWDLYWETVEDERRRLRIENGEEDDEDTEEEEE
jgi:hypothetical protein